MAAIHAGMTSRSRRMISRTRPPVPVSVVIAAATFLTAAGLI